MAGMFRTFRKSVGAPLDNLSPVGSSSRVDAKQSRKSVDVSLGLAANNGTHLTTPASSGTSASAVSSSKLGLTMVGATSESDLNEAAARVSSTGSSTRTSTASSSSSSTTHQQQLTSDSAIRFASKAEIAGGGGFSPVASAPMIIRVAVPEEKTFKTIAITANTSATSASRELLNKMARGLTPDAAAALRTKYAAHRIYTQALSDCPTAEPLPPDTLLMPLILETSSSSAGDSSPGGNVLKFYLQKHEDRPVRPKGSRLTVLLNSSSKSSKQPSQAVSGTRAPSHTVSGSSGSSILSGIRSGRSGSTSADAPPPVASLPPPVAALPPLSLTHDMQKRNVITDDMAGRKASPASIGRLSNKLSFANDLMRQRSLMHLATIHHNAADPSQPKITVNPQLEPLQSLPPPVVPLPDAHDSSKTVTPNTSQDTSSSSSSMPSTPTTATENSLSSRQATEKANNALHELLLTERNFVFDLDLLLEAILKPLRNREVLPGCYSLTV
jgi:hypothetical protein